MQMGGTIHDPPVTTAENVSAHRSPDEIDKNQIFGIPSFRPVITQFTAAVKVTLHPACGHINGGATINQTLSRYSKRTAIDGSFYNTSDDFHSSLTHYNSVLTAAVKITFYIAILG